MLNFEFNIPTRVIFGKGTEALVGKETKKYGTKVLLHYGRESIKKSGLYDKVVMSLKEAGIEYFELGGVCPNPRLSLVREGIELCRKKNIDFILAVGGGSVIDSAKAIDVGVPYEGDVWDFYTGAAMPEKSLPVGVILTIPAAGSETSKSSVITNEDGSYKRALNTEIIKPKFAIMNPELTFTLPPYQTACGAADIMAHVIERYFTTVKNVELTDRLCESVLKTMIVNTPEVLRDPYNYNARAEMMWAGSIAHNDLLSTGRIADFASHMIEHELSAINDVAHGAGLAVIIPAWMQYVYRYDIARFVQFASRVWNVEVDYANMEKTAFEGIMKLKAFFHEIGLPVSLGEIGIGSDMYEQIAEKCRKAPDGTVGNFVKLKKSDIISILKLAE